MIADEHLISMASGFSAVSDEELAAVGQMVDAVVTSAMLAEDPIWLAIVHAFKNELLARAWSD